MERDLMLEIIPYNKEITELYFFIYDPNSFLLKREEFIIDLEKDKPEQFEKVKIIIKPEL